MTLLCLPWPFGLAFNLERERQGFDRFLAFYAARYAYIRSRA